ncbi:DUF2141 domain-containing protein [Erythrobacter sp. CCH5-A1]|jgi:uncharacterized protein (DUF2141 family)|uniref:DUF2141 domain-containing protein n=1 Tax=Erythrobacter sp. CCH5-A1 TaxID=1768792 RepID=UPI00082D760D|nr:DUF2141 domain-containing protein [Erythrobacter sp. CCH5-A1]
MTAISSPSLLARRALAGLALVAVLAAPVAAQGYAYGRAVGNDLGQCAAGKGPAVRITVTGLKSSAGNLFVRAYPAQKSDWLVSKRYVIRVDAKPQAGSMTVCVPLPSTGDFAIAVQHDVNGNRKTDISTDGAGMSNNPGFKKVLGIIPQAPPLEKVRFSAGPGVTRMTISMIYL